MKLVVLSVQVGHFLETTEKSNVRPMAFHGLPGGMGQLFGPEYALAVSWAHLRGRIQHLGRSNTPSTHPLPQTLSQNCGVFLFSESRDHRDFKPSENLSMEVSSRLPLNPLQHTIITAPRLRDRYPSKVHKGAHRIVPCTCVPSEQADSASLCRLHCCTSCITPVFFS